MAVKSGVWVDAKKAIVVKLDQEDKTFKVIDSGIETRERTDGEKKKFGRFAHQFLSFEKRKQRKQADQEKRYFKVIIQELSGADDVVLFGPSSTKHKLEKEIKGMKNAPFNLKGVEDADSMTDNQVGAWVNQYFNN